MSVFLQDGLYTYINLLLIGWVALFLRCVIAGRSQIKQGISGWMGQSFYLLGKKGEWMERHLATPLFCIPVGMYAVQLTALQSLWIEQWPQTMQFLCVVCEHLVAICLIGKIVFATRYTPLQIGVAFSVFFVFRWVFINNHEKWMLIALLFCLAAKEVNLRLAAWVDGILVAVSCLAVVVTSLLGIVPTLVEESHRGIRNSFGYGWYNYLGAILLGLGLIYVYLRSVRRPAWYDTLVLLSLAAFSHVGPNSRAATMGLLLLVLGWYLVGFCPNLWKNTRFQALVACLPLLLCMASGIMVLGWRDNAGWAHQLNQLFSGRLELASQALEGTSFAIAGQAPADWMLVDNVYLYHWIISGPVASLLLWAGFSLGIARMLRHQHVLEALCLSVMALHGLMEHHILWANLNIGIWLLCGVVYWTNPPQSFAPQRTTK